MRGARLTRGNGGLDNCYLQVWTRLAEHVGRAETAGPSTNDDNVTLGVGIKVLEVAAGHGTGDLTLTDMVELEAFPFVGKLLEDLILALGSHLLERLLCWQRGAHGRGLSEHGGWWRHDGGRSKWQLVGQLVEERGKA